MRREFHPLLLDSMRDNPEIHLIVGDLGFGMWDQIFREFPDRAHNVGAAEQLMLGVAIGLAERGKIPVVYSITPFLLWRAAEWIRNYVEHEKVSLHFAAGGRDQDYHEDGFTHFAGDDKDLLRLFPTVRAHWPADVTEMRRTYPYWLYDSGPSYMNLRR